MRAVTLPWKFEPRPYQIPLFDAFQNRGLKRLITVWHRRAGKDKSYVNLLALAALQRVGTYYYFFPTYAQGKKIFWDGMDGSGFRFLDHFPKSLRAGDPNNTEMKIKLCNGSLVQVVGADNIDSIVGTNPVGCVFSEFALQDPKGWDFISPILLENGGWAAFNFTPRGKNHAWKLYQMSKNNPAWFSQLLTVEQTGVLTPEQIQEERDAGKSEEFIQQEYYCSFESGMQGSYYGRELDKADEQGRIGAVPYDPRLLVETWWDLGIGDSTAIWFTQTHLNQVRVFDYLEDEGEGLPFYARELNRKGYQYAAHYAPHDIEVRELGSGRSRLETARELGIHFNVLPKLRIEDGIDAARAIFNRCWFDAVKCARGLEALVQYHKEFDDKRDEYKNRPYHDWSSHAADAFRYLAIGHRDAILPQSRDRYARRSAGYTSWKTA